MSSTLTMDLKKSQRVPPFTLFRTVTLQKSHLQFFFGNLLKSPKGTPFNFFSDCATNWRFTKPKGPPFTLFGTVTLFKNFIFKIFSSLQRVQLTLQFFHILQPSLEFHRPQRVQPFTILSLRYSADFGRSRLVLVHLVAEIDELNTEWTSQLTRASSSDRLLVRDGSQFVSQSEFLQFGGVLYSQNDRLLIRHEVADVNCSTISVSPTGQREQFEECRLDLLVRERPLEETLGL